MLLIRDDQTECAEEHILLNQRVGSHHNIQHSHLQRSQQLLALAAVNASRQQSDSDAKRLEHLGQRAHVLFGKNFCRHHQRPLKTRSYGSIQRNGCEYRFTGAHIPLQQTVHAVAGTHILQYLQLHMLLGICQLKR
ncbi:hypothetical protein D3C74_415250 [compost metagenome]